MNIRRAEERDISGLNRLLCQVLDVHHNGRPDLFKGGAKKYTDEELSLILKDDTRPIFVAVTDQNEMLGYAFCVFIQHKDNNILTDVKTLYIDDLCVDATTRGTGVGKALYEYVLAFARSEDCYNLTLNVWACNTGAIRFYEKMGLVPQKFGMETILDKN